MAEPAAPEIRIEDDDNDPTLSKGRPLPTTGLSLSNKLMRSLSGNPIEGRRGSSPSGATDPITQNIMDRKSLEHSSPQMVQRRGAQGLASGLESPEPRRSDSRPRGSLDLRGDHSLSSSAPKDKKARTSFLSRLRPGASKKHDSMDLSKQVDDDQADAGAARSEGVDAAVFSQPMGYIPKFSEPPKYIKVKARAKLDREFDRLFLAQELRGRTGVEIAQAGGHKIAVDTKMKHDNATWAIEFSKDGRYLAAGGKGHVLRVWGVISSEADRRDEEKAEENASGASGGVKLSAPVFKSCPVQEYEGHTASILSVSWSKNNFLLSSSMDKTVRLWHVSRAECLCVFKHPDHVPAVQFHPQDDRFFLAGSLDSKLRLWSIPDKTVAYSTVVKDLITAVAFTPDGKSVIAGTLQGHCIFYDTEHLREQTKMHVRSAHGKNAKGSKITGIQAKSFPPNDPRGAVKLLITSNDSRIRIYNLRDKSLELKLKGYENVTSQLRATFSDDARHIVCGSEDKKCYVWNMCRPDKDRERHPLETFEVSNDVVTCGVFAPTATKQLLQASGDPVFEICNPPPVQLLSKDETKSIRSNGPDLQQEIERRGSKIETEDLQSKLPAKALPSPTAEKPSTFKTRSAHPGGHIIITADTEGQVRCFRSDCAYKNRLKNNENWEAGSTFSKKVLHRSSSIATRASRNSLVLRDSIVNMGQPGERILSWRQSIDRSGLPPDGAAAAAVGVGSPSMKLAGGGSRPTRSASPRKSLSGLTSILQGRRSSGTAGMFTPPPPRTEPHPLSTSVSNTPVASSAAQSSAQSLQSESSGRMSSGGAGKDKDSTPRMLRPDEFGALGIKDDGSSANGTVRRTGRHRLREPPRANGGGKHRGYGDVRGSDDDDDDEEEDDYTGDEDEDYGVGSDDGDASSGSGDEQRCRACGGDSFKAVRLGRGRGTRLQCASCGVAARAAQ